MKKLLVVHNHRFRGNGTRESRKSRFTHISAPVAATVLVFMSKDAETMSLYSTCEAYIGLNAIFLKLWQKN